jgi:hypothetical protein
MSSIHNHNFSIYFTLPALKKRVLIIKALYQRTRTELVDLIKACVVRRIMQSLTANDRLDQLITDILAKKTDPYPVSEDIVARTLTHCKFLISGQEMEAA